MFSLDRSEDLIHVCQQLLLLGLDTKKRRHLVLEVANNERMHAHKPRSSNKITYLVNIMST
jgi:hypothetical protein